MDLRKRRISISNKNNVKLHGVTPNTKLKKTTGSVETKNELPGQQTSKANTNKQKNNHNRKAKDFEANSYGGGLPPSNKCGGKALLANKMTKRKLVSASKPVCVLADVVLNNADMTVNEASSSLPKRRSLKKNVEETISGNVIKNKLRVSNLQPHEFLLKTRLSGQVEKNLNQERNSELKLKSLRKNIGKAAAKKATKTNSRIGALQPVLVLAETSSNRGKLKITNECKNSSKQVCINRNDSEATKDDLSQKGFLRRVWQPRVLLKQVKLNNKEEDDKENKNFKCTKKTDVSLKLLAFR